jgi:superfamily I DNA and/or RNA helicase
VRPEIIAFSNTLCYQGNPLIPLRQVGKNRLEPLKRTYLPHGIRTGDINDAEAHAIVDAIATCHEDPAYDESDFGVICLQGDMQGARIEQFLLDRLGPDVFTKRRLRCGNPHVFQGDERDVMFLSMVAAPNARQQSLTTTMYEQRFNVAMSRARDQAWLFHSIQEDELGANCLRRRRVLEFFRNPPEQTINGSSSILPAFSSSLPERTEGRNARRGRSIAGSRWMLRWRLSPEGTRVVSAGRSCAQADRSCG